MPAFKRDPNLDTLLELNGQIMAIDGEGKYWVKFEVDQIEPSPTRPHGLRYSLSLHDENNERLVGFDNAHAVRTSKGPGGGQREEHDHKHRFRTIQPYDYEDAATLLADFWAEVESVLDERGVKP